MKEVCLESVEFRVGKGGQSRARREQQRNVHAYAVGILTEGCEMSEAFKRISYNPYQHDTFVLPNGEPIARADKCLLNSHGCFAYLAA